MQPIALIVGALRSSVSEFTRVVRTSLNAFTRLLIAPLLTTLLTTLLATTVVQAQEFRPRLVGNGNVRRLEHDGTSSPQVFPPQRWILIAPQSRFGATVIWESGPFQHLREKNSLADIGLEVEIRRSNRIADWRTIQPADRSRIDRGKDVATVVARSSRRGNGIAELTVTFLESPEHVPIEGVYEAIVVATITEN